VLAVAALTVIWVGVWHRTQSERQALEANALAQQRGVAVILSENLTQVVDRGRLIAIAASAWFEDPQPDAIHRLGGMLAADQAFLRGVLYDAALKPRFQSSPLFEGADFMQQLRQAGGRLPTPGGSSVEFVGDRTRRSDRWDVPRVLPVFEPGGAVRGYLLLSLDLGYLLSLYRDVELGPSGSIHVLARDGTAVAEARPEGLSGPRKLRQMADIAASPSVDGHLTLDMRGDGDTQLSVFRRSDRTPFTVVVSRGRDDILGAHTRFSLGVWITLCALTAVLVLVAWVWLRSLRRQQSLINALSRSDHEKHGLIVLLEDEKSRALTLASFDHLTGLNNRRMFNELAASHLAAARRSKKHYALLYFDLDRFKLINDSLGHHVGDLLLQAVAERLRENVRSSDIVGRMGGDEFAVLITGVENVADIDVIAAKLVAEISRPYPALDGHEVHVTPSIGIAFFPRDGHDITVLCRNADAAMYQSKRAGRGRYTYYDAAMNPSGSRSLTLERQLPRAIADGELVLHFQPKVQLSDMRIVGLEALVRWRHPEFGLVYPGEFIALAEASGLIAELGDWVMAACCSQLAAWKSQGLPTVPVAFNVSPHQLRDEQVVQRIASLLDQHGLTAQDIEIEITESCLVEPIDVAVRVLGRLEAMGLRIGLDDFGSGFSSLSQVRHLPIHKLKIDRSFVNDLRSSNDVGVIVTSIITLAHNLGMRVVAEGVELMDQLLYLKTANCDEVQGYFLSRPVGADDTARLLQHGHVHPQ